MDKWAFISSILAFVLLFNYLFSIDLKITPNLKTKQTPASTSTAGQKPNQAIVQQQNVVTSVTLPIKWGDLGKKLVDSGVIDRDKLEQAVGTLAEPEKKLLENSNNEQIVMTEANSRILLDILWAFGLANKNDVLDKGEIMQDPKQAGNYASTGGWTLAKGSAMNHFSKYSLVTLTADQQKMVEDMSKGIFRPCCNNSTHFPDCNHGMAMLGLLELLAANNVSQTDAYSIALKVNALWFPQTYQDMATYFSEQGVSWDKVDPKIALSANYSSASGYKQFRSQIKSLPQPTQGGGGCGI